MDPERPKNPVEEVALPKAEKRTAETLQVPDITAEQKAEAERSAAERIVEIREQLQPKKN